MKVVSLAFVALIPDRTPLTKTPSGQVTLDILVESVRYELLRVTMWT